MSNDKNPNQQDNVYVKVETNKENKFNNDVIKISSTLDSIAKLILARRKQTEPIKNDIETEYNTKLNHLNTLINSILKLNEYNESNTNSIVDTTKLDTLLKDKIDIIEKDGQSFALIPIKKEITTDNNNYDDIIIDTNKKNKKKKRRRRRTKFHVPFATNLVTQEHVVIKDCTVYNSTNVF